MRNDEAARRCRNVLLTLSIALYAASFLLPATISNRGGHTDPGFVLFFAAFLYFPYGLVAQLPNVFLWIAFAAMADGRPGRAAGYSLAGVPFAGLAGFAMMGMGCCGSYSHPYIGYWAWVGSMVLLGLGCLTFAGVLGPDDRTEPAYPVGPRKRNWE